MSKGGKSPIEVVIAKYGLVQSLIGALIGIIGAIIVAYFGYLGVKTQTEGPIKATQTYEAKPSLISTILVLAETRISSPSPSETVPATYISSPPPSETVPASIALPLTPTPLEADKLLRIYNPKWRDNSGSQNDLWRVLPSNIDPTNRNERVGVDDIQAGWLLGPSPNLEASIVSINRGPEWIKIEKTAKVTVFWKGEVPDHVNVYGGDCLICAMLGVYRGFEPASLKSGFETYTLNINYPEADFFLLEPGEIEGFVIPFKCADPGVYTVSIEFPFEVLDQTSSIVLKSSPAIVCPMSYTTWQDVGDSEYFMFTRGDSFIWDGNKYIVKPDTP